jgi:D-3-phosphoglycerate dehydrogenase
MSTRVVITDSDLGAGAEEEVLGEAGHGVVRAACRSEDDVIAAAAGADALIVQWAPVTGAVLDAAPSVRLVSRLGIGYDMVDVAAATTRGVAVANTPDYCVEEVVAHTVGMALALLRGLAAFDRSVRAGAWDPPSAYPAACRPSETTVAVIGLGRIGRRVAAGMAALGFRVIGHDPYLEDTDGIELVPIEGALSRADLVTLHVPLDPSTRRLVDVDALAGMKAGAYLVNTCRGGLVDEDALAGALREGRLAGAALDVFASEPLPESSPLRALEGVLLSPHAAWYSRASLAELPRLCAQQVADFLAGRPVPAIVNPDYALAVS